MEYGVLDFYLPGPEKFLFSASHCIWRSFWKLFPSACRNALHPTNIFFFHFTLNLCWGDWRHDVLRAAAPLSQSSPWGLLLYISSCTVPHQENSVACVQVFKQSIELFAVWVPFNVVFPLTCLLWVSFLYRMEPVLETCYSIIVIYCLVWKSQFNGPHIL
jgi:hypothetical protein